MNEIIKSKHLALIFLLLTTLLPSNIINAEVKKYSIDEAIQTALENNREVKIAFMDIKKADAAVDEAYGYAYPRIDLSGQFYHFIQKVKMPFPDFQTLLGNAVYGILFDEKVLPYDPSKFKPVNYVLQEFSLANNYEAKAQITQVLFSSAVFTGIGTSKIYSQLVREQLKSIVSKVVVNVRTAFYGVTLTKEMVSILEKTIANMEEHFRNVKALYDQGIVSEFDLLQIEVLLENTRPQLTQMQNNLKAATDGLKVLMGINPNEEIDVDGKLEYNEEALSATDDLIQKSYKMNYDLNTLQFKKIVDEAIVDVQRADYYPSLAAFANYSLSGSSDNFKFQNYSSAIVGLNLSINVFSGFQTNKKVEQAKIGVMQTEEQIKQFKDYLALQIRTQVNEIESIKKQIAAQNHNIRLAQKAYDLSLVRFKEGTGTELEVKDSEIQLYSAKTNYLKSVYDYTIAKIKLDNLLGDLDEKWIKLIEK